MHSASHKQAKKDYPMSQDILELIRKEEYRQYREGRPSKEDK
jgi:hypothetical protein